MSVLLLIVLELTVLPFAITASSVLELTDPPTTALLLLIELPAITVLVAAL